MSNSVVQARGLGREYRIGRGRQRDRITAVTDLNFDIRPGEAVGYIGANGAGKSTTIKLLTGILVPTAGSVRTFNHDPVRHRKKIARRIGVVFGQRSGLWWDLPLRSSFEILAAIHSLRNWAARLSDLTAGLELDLFLDQPVRQLSLGQRMRGELAAALLHSPEFLILDEPTIGLDLISKQQLRDFLRVELKQRGMTLLLTTHDLGDIEQLAERIMVADRGHLVFDGRIETLRSQYAGERILQLDLAQACLPLVNVSHTRLIGYSAAGRRQVLAFSSRATSAAAVLSEISHYAEISDLSLKEPDIEDVVRKIYQGS